ncbi:cyclic nucleotide-gated ion channel 4-like isoform X2 [Cicer arietinum]|uniref:Cyclic nucleotide-gated ion channel 4-like isoform X2 n=1 Tax=Cicer arietinum TaxID=3827 RepID=A0A1S2YUB8_CICAR|nr:cyclic nucleotide-gated ion channel 4-like isoform X2 [Cicer arietinum]
MATTTTEQDISRASHVHDTTHNGNVSDDSEVEHHVDDDEEEEEEEELQPVNYRSSISTSTSISRIVDPREKWVQEWNRVFLFVCAAGLFVDPLFFYALSISDSFICIFVDGWFAVTVTALRCMTDALHLWNIFLRFKMAKRSFGFAANSTAVFDSRRSVATAYLKSRFGFFFDVFVILPIPQIVLWVAIPSLLEQGSVTFVMTILLIVFLFQYLPKIYHSVCHLRRTQNLSGYIFGTVWWGIALNMIAYFVASHAAGACWYLLGIQRAAKCLREQCHKTNGCGIQIMSCHKPIYYGSTSLWNRDRARLDWAENREARSTCLSGPDNYNYGAYSWTVQLVTNENRLEKILFPIFWGLMTLSTFGNLESTTDWLEVVFNIIVLTSGLLLVTMLIGNIKVPLFQHMDELVLENICDRVKSLIFTKGETIAREGDPVQRMLFVVRGHLQSSQVLRDGVKSCCMLGPGNFSGDELLSWCLRRPFIERLPLSTSTLVTLETTEAFGLEAEDVKYVTQHFRYTFVKEKVKRSARYYSPGWRTWAAVAIQLAWRRYRHRLTLATLSFIRPRRPLSRCSSLGEDRLRLYTALLTSPKPNQDDFDF